MADAQRREDQAGEEQYGQDVGDRRLGRRALHPALPGPLGGPAQEPIQAVPLVHVGNFKERDPQIFRELPHEDVMEWSYQFQRVSVFNQWGAIQQLRHIEFIPEGVAARWLSGLNPRPDTIDGMMEALQAALRHHNYAC